MGAEESKPRADTPFSRWEAKFGRTIFSDDVSLSQLIANVSSRIFVWHFHTYFDITDAEIKEASQEAKTGVIGPAGPRPLDPTSCSPFEHVKNMREHVLKLRDESLLDCDVGPIFVRPGPLHPKASFETQVQGESLAAAFEFFMMHKADSMSVLCHPNAVDDVANHTTRSSWIGPPLTLKVSGLIGSHEQVQHQIKSIVDGQDNLRQKKIQFLELVDQFIFPPRYGVVHGYRNTD